MRRAVFRSAFQIFCKGVRKAKPVRGQKTAPETRTHNRGRRLVSVWCPRFRGRFSSLLFCLFLGFVFWRPVLVLYWPGHWFILGSMCCSAGMTEQRGRSAPRRGSSLPTTGAARGECLPKSEGSVLLLDTTSVDTSVSTSPREHWQQHKDGRQLREDLDTATQTELPSIPFAEGLGAAPNLRATTHLTIAGRIACTKPEWSGYASGFCWHGHRFDDFAKRRWQRSPTPPSG